METIPSGHYRGPALVRSVDLIIGGPGAAAH
jgi:hypothetical protein